MPGCEKICDNIFKISYDSCIYLIAGKPAIVIDAGNRKDSELIEKDVRSIIDPKEIGIVIFTHLHYDHAGCFDLFADAEFYAARQEIADFGKDPAGTMLDQLLCKKFSARLNPVEDAQKLLAEHGLSIIHVPGHTRGSIALLLKKEGILFSGDTLFSRGMAGRTDLPTSAPQKMPGSISRLKALNAKIICPGHDY